MGTNRVFVGCAQDAAAVEAALRGPGRGEPRSAPGRRRRLPLRGARPLRRRPASAPWPQLARQQGWDLTELHEAPFSLEDTFIALTRASRGHQDRGVA